VQACFNVRNRVGHPHPPFISARRCGRWPRFGRMTCHPESSKTRGLWWTSRCWWSDVRSPTIKSGGPVGPRRRESPHRRTTFVRPKEFTNDDAGDGLFQEGEAPSGRVTSGGDGPPGRVTALELRRPRCKRTPAPNTPRTTSHLTWWRPSPGRYGRAFFRSGSGRRFERRRLAPQASSLFLTRDQSSDLKHSAFPMAAPVNRRKLNSLV